MKYTVVLLKEADGGYSVIVPALRGCATMGDDVPEALEMARDAIRCHLGALAKAGIAPPADAEGFSIGSELWDEAIEASVYRVAVEETVAVA